MNSKSITRCVGRLALLVGLAIAGGSATAMGPTDDYRDFKFSATTPYFAQNGKVDFGTYNGFRRYHSECHVCHGPAGMGSSYAPSLLDSVKTLTFDQFVDVIVRGKSTRENFVMPSFATNMNVLPYLPDLYAYLKARSDGIIGIGRPKRFPKVTNTGRSGR